MSVIKRIATMRPSKKRDELLDEWLQICRPEFIEKPKKVTKRKNKEKD